MHTIRAALSPANSFERFKVSFMNSSASEALKARYARIMNIPYHDVSGAVDEAAGGIPNPSSPLVKGATSRKVSKGGLGLIPI